MIPARADLSKIVHTAEVSVIRVHVYGDIAQITFHTIRVSLMEIDQRQLDRMLQ